MKRFLLVCCLPMLATAAAAQGRCTVTDPTGTPLNVRTSPNGGAIVGALHNGAAVRVLRTAVDARGRPWAYVVPVHGQAGWIFREFVSCY